MWSWASTSGSAAAGHAPRRWRDRIFDIVMREIGFSGAQDSGSADHHNSAVVEDRRAEEIQIMQDRILAMRLSEQDAGRVPERFTQPVRDSRMEFDAADAAASGYHRDQGRRSQAGPSGTSTKQQGKEPMRPSTGEVCCVCLDTLRPADVVKAACEHRYCMGCAKKLFMLAARDETLFPPRCCQKLIPPERVTWHMSSVERHQYEMARIEFNKPDRLYCSKRGCGKFILPRLVDRKANVGTCSACRTRTCCLCKNEEHREKECPDDPALRLTRRLAKLKGWQTCPSCGRVIELGSGCNHIT